jgi:LPXTG-motif cell wall-anchored protein
MTAVALLAGPAAAQTSTKEQIKNSSKVATQQLSGVVVYSGGGQVVVKMASGELKTFTPPADKMIMIDGQEVAARDLKVGTSLKATITTTTTSVTERTTSVNSGKVWYVAAPTTVIVTMANGENKQFKVTPDYKFDVEGKKVTVFELKKGMIVSGQKIVEEPIIMVASNTTITGHAPPTPKPVVAQAPATIPAPAPVKKAAAPAPAPVAEAPLPAKLPKTGSPLPLAGLLGLLFTGAGLGLRKLRRS